MNIVFKTPKMSRIFNNIKLLSAEYGPDRAKLILRRLSQMKSADHLLEFSRLPPVPRCHELQKRDGVDRRGQFSARLDGSWRLIFEPAGDQLPVDENGKLIWDKVRTVRILSVENYHD